jgi:hypothetical protein
MDRPILCPNCLSKYLEIHGMLYRDGKPVGERCEDIWHRGPEYDPDRWILSAQDEEFLETQKISIR